MEHEHESTGDALGEIRTVTQNFELPANACATVRALYEGLQALESDLHVHIHQDVRDLDAIEAIAFHAVMAVTIPSRI